MSNNSKYPVSERLTISVPEAANEAGCSAKYMYELLRRADCTFCLRLGRKIRIDRLKFERWIHDQAGSYV